MGYYPAGNATVAIAIALERLIAGHTWDTPRFDTGCHKGHIMVSNLESSSDRNVLCQIKFSLSSIFGQLVMD